MIRILYLFFMCVLIRCVKTIENITQIEGHKNFTAFLIALDTIFFLMVFRDVIINDLSLPVVFAISAGYIIGYLVGAYIEDKIALGKVMVTIKIESENSHELASVLRNNGFVFVESKSFISGTGRPKTLHQGIIYRKELPKLKRITKDFQIIATVGNLKSTFGLEPVKADDYLQIEDDKTKQNVEKN